MGTGTLHIDLDAVAANWRALSALAGAGCETAAVVKADAYGLGAGPVARRLAREGVRTFFVAVAEEGAAVRAAVGPGPAIFVMAGHMEGDAPALAGSALNPVLNSPGQVERHLAALPGHGFAVHLDTGLNRLGIEPQDWRALKDRLRAARPALVMSHLACADEPGHPANGAQAALFRDLTADMPVRRSLSATGGILLGRGFCFDLVRPGVGLYGGAPFTAARPVLRLSLPVIQTRWVEPGEIVGYGCGWTAGARSRIATVAAGYADGLHRRLAGRLRLWTGRTPCPAVGRLSMDLITVDVTGLDVVPDRLEVLGPEQGIDDLARAAGTIGYELLTQLGRRYGRTYAGAVP
ncbi:MAG: alanine racemase [Pseudomonadota bacterium]